MGWEAARATIGPPIEHGSADASAHLPGLQQYAVAPYAAADLSEMRALYDRYNAGRPGTLLRPEPYWRSVMVRSLETVEYPGQRNGVYVARRDGRVAAYCFAFTEEDSLYLSELAYDEPEAVASLLKAAWEGVGEPAPRRLVAILPWDNAALRRLETRGEPIQPLGIMWRINDLAGLLRQVQPVLDQRLASAPSLEPGGETGGVVLASDRGTVALEVSQNGLHIGGSPGPYTFPCCRLAQTALVTMVLGSYTTPQWLDGLELPAEARPLAGEAVSTRGGRVLADR